MSQRFAVDSSVLIATIKSEDDSAHFLSPLIEGPIVIGWPTILETRLWIIRNGGHEAGTWLGAWLSAAEVSVIPFDQALEELAAQAFERFGKGLHPASLNFGDCMSYAVAVHHDVPLLFKGADFGKTDVRVHKASIVLG